MLQLTPKTVFIATQKESAQEHSALVRSSRFSILLTFVLAKRAADGATSEQLKGAKDFIDDLLNMAEKPEPIKSLLPPKDLGSKPPEKEKK